MPTKYDPKSVEQGRYEWWLEGKFFEAQPESEKTIFHRYSTTKRNRKITLGHAWDTTLQDIIIRMKRMQGYDALWLPGMDHAGIATQAKVEAKVA